MELIGIDGLPCYVRASEILFCGSGTAKRPGRVLAPNARQLALSNGHAGAVEIGPTEENVAALVLTMKNHPATQGVSDTPENREKINEALNTPSFQ